MSETVAEPPQQEATTQSRTGAPWYVVAAVALLSVFACGMIVSEGRMLDSSRYFVRNFIPSLVLLPIAAAVAWVPWAIKRKRQTYARFSTYFMWSAGSLTVLLVGLYVTAIQVEARRKAAAIIPPSELSKLVLFDGSMGYNASGDRRTVSGVSGRIRNETKKAIDYVKIGVTIRDGQGTVIESFDFTQYIPLRPGEAMSVDYQKFIHRVPNDMKWEWQILEGRYAY